MYTAQQAVITVIDKYIYYYCVSVIMVCEQVVTFTMPSSYVCTSLFD